MESKGAAKLATAPKSNGNGEVVSMKTHTMRTGWFVALMLAAGCTVENSAAVDETGADQGAPAKGQISGALPWHDGQPNACLC